MTGIIDVGGGLRGIYGAGVLDRCLDDGLSFDLCIGVSAGSANLAAFLGGQRGRNYRFYTDYPLRPDYMSARNIRMKGAFIDLDYVYRVLSNADGEDPLCFQRIRQYDGTFLLTATDERGQAVYFSKDDMAQDNYRIIRASSALPVICGGCEIGGKTFFDGGIADPIPVEKAFALGCDRVVVILTRALEYPVRDTMDRAGAAVIRRQYPLLAETLRRKAAKYRTSLAFARAMARKGRCLIVSPKDTCGVEMLTRDKNKLHALYEQGVQDGAQISRFGKECHSLRKV